MSNVQCGIIFTLLIMAFSVTLYAQEVVPPRNNLEPDRIEALKSELKKVSLVDGISEAEANILVHVYSDVYIGCGSLTEVTDNGDHWLVHGFVGRGAKPVTGFTIMKTTGEMVSTVGPSFKDFSKLME